MGKIKELLIKYKEPVLYVDVRRAYDGRELRFLLDLYGFSAHPVHGIDSAFVGAFSYLCVCDEPQVGV